MNDPKFILAEYLLQSKAIIFEPANPFTWASGWKSPIYCDNRITLSRPEIRDFIRTQFCNLISQYFPGTEIIAGVATGAIAHGVLVADQIKLPFIYVRPSAKKHGRQNLIEGEAIPGKKVTVIEDLISTGGSSLNALTALRKAGLDVLGMAAIFSYGFKIAENNFEAHDCSLHTLTDYNTVIQIARETNYIKKEDLSVLMSWKEDPKNWNPQK
jgi:orotate phosphoribosyltransferase